jgi:uncharacterized membrane protein YgcG
LVDEVANTLDVSATIVDLAVRKYLVIEEIPKTWLLGKPDWNLRLLPEPADDALLPYEKRLLDGLFEDGDQVELSALRTTFAERLRAVKDALYNDVVSRKWFLWRPDRVRHTWTVIGWLALSFGIAITIALAAFTKYGLLGIPLVTGGILLLIGANRMPARTAKGTAMTRRVDGFRVVIEKAEEHMSKWAEQENVFTRFLPYAVVFGVTDKWAKAFESLGQLPSDTTWFVSSRPFVYAQFAHSIDSFTVQTSGTISSTPAGSGSSGFGGGGFGGGGAGGGGGGGGGGSW